MFRRKSVKERLRRKVEKLKKKRGMYYIPSAEGSRYRG